MQYASSPKWDTEQLNFDFIGDIFDTYIKNPAEGNVNDIVDTFLNNGSARETIHKLAMSNIWMTRRQVEVKIKHYIRAVLPLTLSLPSILRTLESSSMREYVENDNNSDHYYIYSMSNSPIWKNIILDLIIKSSNPEKYKKVTDTLNAETNPTAAYRTKLRLGKDGRIRIFIPLYDRAVPTSVTCVVNPEDITFDKIRSYFDTDVFKQFTTTAKELLLARVALFFNMQRIILSGKREKLEQEIYSYLMDQVIPNSDNPEWTVNYAPDHANLKFTMKCTDLMKSLPHFSTKDKLNGVMKVSRAETEYEVELSGISFTDYRTSFGIHTPLDLVMRNHCSVDDFPKLYNVPQRNTPENQHALYLTTVFNFILPEIEYTPLYTPNSTIYQPFLKFIMVEMGNNRRHTMPRSKRKSREDCTYCSSAYYIDSNSTSDSLGNTVLMTTNVERVGFLNKNDLKFMLLINGHDISFANRSTPKSTFNIITNSVFWKHWANISTGEIYYLIDILSSLTPTFIKNMFSKYFKTNNFVGYFNELLNTPIHEKMCLSIQRVIHEKQFYSNTFKEAMYDENNAQLITLQTQTLDKNSSKLILTSEEFVSQYEPRKFLPPAIKRMLNVNTAIVMLAGGQCGSKTVKLFNENYKNPPKIEVSNTNFPLYNANALDVKLRQNRDSWEMALEENAIRVALHIALIFIAGNRIGNNLTMRGKLHYGKMAKDYCDTAPSNSNNIISLLNSCNTGNPFTILHDIGNDRGITSDMHFSFKLGQIPSVVSYLDKPVIQLHDITNGYAGHMAMISVKDSIAIGLSKEKDYILSPHGIYGNLNNINWAFNNTLDPSTNIVTKQIHQLRYTSFLLSFMFDRIFKSPTLTMDEKHTIESLCHPRYLNLNTFIDATTDKFISTHNKKEAIRQKKVFTFMNLPRLEKELKVHLASTLTEDQQVIVLNTKEQFANAGKTMSNCVGGRSYSNGNNYAFKVNDTAEFTSHFFVVIDSPFVDNRWCMDFIVGYSSDGKLTIKLFEGRGFSNRRQPDTNLVNDIIRITSDIFNKYFVRFCDKIIGSSIVDNNLDSPETKHKIIKNGDKITTRYNKWYGNNINQHTIFKTACNNASESDKLVYLNSVLERMFNTYMETIFILRHNKAASSILRKHKFMDSMLSTIIDNNQFTAIQQEIA